MSSAPGGKSSYIGQLMNNTGLLVANDISLKRIPALKYNLSRMGVNNALVICEDGRNLKEVFKKNNPND